MHIYVRLANFTTKPHFQSVNLRMNSQSSKVEKNAQTKQFLVYKCLQRIWHKQGVCGEFELWCNMQKVYCYVTLLITNLTFCQRDIKDSAWSDGFKI